MSEPSITGYRAIKEEILNRIRTRIWPSGHAIPSELELAEEFGCARGTINRAMLELQEEGVIDRKRKAGTRVAISPVRQARFTIPLVRVEIESTGANYRYQLLSRTVEKAPQWLAARLSLVAQTKMLHVRCLHLADAKPYQFEDRWIHIAAVPAVMDEPFTTINPNEWLVQAVPFTDVEFSFQATSASIELADFLSVEIASPVFLGERTTWLSGVPVTFASMYFPGTYKMVTRL